MNVDTDCLACEGKNPVNWLLTRLNPSATLRVCEQDVPQALTALLATELGVEAGWLTAQINAAIDVAEAADQAAEQQQLSEDQAAEGMPQDNALYEDVLADE